MGKDASTTAGPAVEGLKQGMIADGLITKKQLKTAEGKAQREGGTLGRMLVGLGYVTQEQLASFIGEKMKDGYLAYVNYTFSHPAAFFTYVFKELGPGRWQRHFVKPWLASLGLGIVFIITAAIVNH